MLLTDGTPSSESSNTRLILYEKDNNRGRTMVIYAQSGAEHLSWGDIRDLDDRQYEFNDVARSATLIGPPGTTVWLYDDKGFDPDDDNAVLEIQVPDGATSVTLGNLNRTQLGVRFIRRGGIQGKVSGVRWVSQQLPPSVPELGRVTEAIQRFAPEVHLYPDEVYRPSSVPWYLARVRMRRHRLFLPDQAILGVGQVNVTTLVSQQRGNEHSGQGGETRFFLQIQGDEQVNRNGDLSTAECYAHFRPAIGGRPEFDIQYWFFYPYNGDITAVLDPAHEGDWEHITVRVSPDLQRVVEVFFATHKRESRWLRDGYQLSQGTHPVVYSARHSHASYWTVGEQPRGGIAGVLPNDRTAGGGPIWRTWERLVNVGTFEAPAPGQEWVRYTGRWGELGTRGASQALVSSGPFGPAFQPWWSDDDKMLQ